MLVRKGLIDQSNVVKHGVATTPRLIPVITDTPHKLRRLRIGEQCADSLIDQIAIVIPGDDLLVAQTRTAQRWSKIILEKVSFFLGRVNTRFPFLSRHRFILDRESPDRYAFRLVGPYELRVIVGPRLIELGFQFTAVQNVVVVFHERRRAPRAREDIELAFGGGENFLDEWNPILLVVRKTERTEFFVAFVDVGVNAAREITTVNIRAREFVADASLLVEVCIDKFALLLFREFGERFGGGVGQCATDAEERLKLPAGIDKHADLSFFRLSDRFESDRV